MRELCAHRRRRAETHRGVAAGREDGTRLVDRELLPDAVFVPADVGGDECVPRQRLAHVGENSLGPHRIGVALRVRAVAREKKGAGSGDFSLAFRALDALRQQLARGPVERRQRLLQVGDGADLHRIVAADLRGIDVYVDETSRREVERVLGLPGAAVGFGEARAEAENPVGRAALLVDEAGSPEAGHAEHEGVVVRERTLAHQGVRDRNLQVVDEFPQLCGRVR